MRAPIPHLGHAGVVLALALGACMAPPPPEPRAREAPPLAAPPPARVRVELSAPGMSAETMEREVVAPLEHALAGVPGLRRLFARVDEGAAELALEGVEPRVAEVREALVAARPRLPTELREPIVRVEPEEVAVVFRHRDDPDLVSALQRLSGVARVEVCGGREEVVRVELDLARVGARGVGIDEVLHALGDTGRGATLEALAATPLPGGGRVSDVAQVARTHRPTECRDHRDAERVTFLIFPQRGAELAALASAVRAAAPEAQDFMPAPEQPGPARLDLELAGAAEPAALAACLAAAPRADAWALVGPEPGPAPRRLRAVVPGPAGAGARDALVGCGGVLRASLASDEALALAVIGPGPAELAATAERAAQGLARLRELTWIWVVAPRERPRVDLALDRDALAASGAEAGRVASAARLVAGPAALPGAPGVVVEVSPRTGQIEQDLAALSVRTARGLTPLASLVRVAAAPGWAPRYRVDRQAAAFVELRARRPEDRGRVQEALGAELRLPAGVRVELGRALPW